MALGRPEIDIRDFKKHEAERLITCRQHPTDDLLIWNYTPRCVYENIWDETTMMARGLITSLDGAIVARPFRKFFSLEQLEQLNIKIPPSPFAVYDKMDGSLCISYPESWTKFGLFKLATRGSFESEQAAWANEIVRRKYSEVELDTHHFTYLFELIDPRNRIVVDYGKVSDLVLLAIVETATGQERDIDDADLPFPRPKKYGFQKLDEIVDAEQDDEREGFVLKFQTNERVKFKFAEYKRLHKLLTQVSTKSIWESLRDGKPLDEILERVPDEFYTFVKTTKANLEKEFGRLEQQIQKCYAEIEKLPTRKDKAEYILTNYRNTASAVFSLIDGKQYANILWKMIKPKFSKAFKIDLDTP